jgi:hypothetical protein
MPRKHQVIELFEREPHLSSGEIAARLGCGSSWVRATFQRNGLKLARSGNYTSPKAWEREECARLADEMGAPDVAQAIRARL